MKPKEMEPKEMVVAASRLLDCISMAQEFIQRVPPPESCGWCFETFVVDKVQEWTPEGRQQAGWVLFPLNGNVYTNWRGNPPVFGEFVAFEDIGKIDDQKYVGPIPKIGDVAIVGINGKTLLREKIELLRCKEE